MVTARPLRKPRQLKVFLIAGEASGDAYGAHLIRELNTACQSEGLNLETVGWGGDAMNGEGMRLLTHFTSINFMGFLEVAQNLPSIFQNLKRAKKDIVREDPDVIVTIDFPGFNMRLARALRRLNHSAMRIQWIAPQVWAWRSGRVARLREDFDVVVPILPFEIAHLESAGVPIWNVGHPLLDLVPDSAEGSRPIRLALLPGSRKQELERHLPVMIDAALEGAMQGLWAMKDVVIAGAPGRTELDYALAREQGMNVVFGDTHHILGRARLAWVTSGTATLEAALLDTPHVVVYQTSWITYRLAKWLAQVKFIGLPNLLLNREAVPELIQNKFNRTNLLSQTKLNLDNQKVSFEELKIRLGSHGAGRRLAQNMVDVFRKD